MPSNRPRFGLLITPLILASSLAPAPIWTFCDRYFIHPLWAQTTTDRKTEADKLRLQGIRQFHANQFKRAVDSWQKALVIYREIKDRQGEARSLHNLGLGHSLVGIYQPAIAFLQESLTITREIKDRELEANSLRSLGDAYYELGQYPKALETFQQVLPIYKEIGDRACAKDAKDRTCTVTRKLEGSIQSRMETIRQKIKQASKTEASSHPQLTLFNGR